MFGVLAFANDGLYRDGSSNVINAYKIGNRELYGSIELKGNNQLVYNYGTNGIVFKGSYRFENRGANRILRIDVRDVDNTTIFADSAIIEIDVTNVDLNDLDSNDGLQVQLNNYIDGASSPSRQQVIFKRQ